MKTPQINTGLGSFKIRHHAQDSQLTQASLVDSYCVSNCVTYVQLIVFISRGIRINEKNKRASTNILYPPHG